MKIKYIFIFLISVIILTGCSKISELFESVKQIDLGSKQNEQEEEIKKIEFYNKYVDVLNTLSPYIDNFQKEYDKAYAELNKKNNRFLMFMGDLHISFIESNIKKYKRSFYEGGELSKLEVNDEAMKSEIKNEFINYIREAESYYTTCLKINQYYKEKTYDDFAAASEEINSKYSKYSERFSSFKQTLKKFKPVIKLRNPDDYSTDDEKALAIMQNVTETSMTLAEKFYEKFNMLNDTSDIAGINKECDMLSKTFENDRQKVEKAPFTEKTKYIKYSFQDYYTKMYNEFLLTAEKLKTESDNNRLTKESFAYIKEVLGIKYNILVQAHNNTINLINTFKIY